MAEEPLDIDDLWDIESIERRLEMLRNMISYGNDFSEKARTAIDILEARKRQLQ